MTSSPSGNNFSLIPWNNCGASPPGRSQRPTPPAKKTSPPTKSFWGRRKKQRLPGQWPELRKPETLPQGIRARGFLNEKMGVTGSRSKPKPKFRKKLESEIMGGIRVTTYRAIKFSLNFRDIDDVIDVSRAEISALSRPPDSEATRNFPLERQIEQLLPRREKDSNLFRKLSAKCLVFHKV